jgi:RNA polymerase sigma-70 factor (family 1)
MNSISSVDISIINSLKTPISEGDQVAFKRLYDLLFKKMVQFAIAIVKNQNAAVEIVDEVFVKFWKNRQNANAINNLRVYFYTAVKNTALNHLSQNVNEQKIESFDYVDVQVNDNITPEQLMITSELFSKIKIAVNNLPPKCKVIFKLVREDGLTYKEVSKILNISENTVDAQLVIAVKRIREALKNHIDIIPSKIAKK